MMGLTLIDRPNARGYHAVLGAKLSPQRRPPLNHAEIVDLGECRYQQVF